MSVAWSIRPARGADTAGIVALWCELAEFHAQGEPFLALADDAAARFAEHLEQSLPQADGRVWVAEHAGAVIGFCMARKTARPPVFRVRAQVFIDAIAVTAAWRRRGVGQALVAPAAAWAEELGGIPLTCQAAVRNELSTSFWCQRGFRPYLAALVRAT
jgi:GNAT superfamily N-acetyltransferase